MSNVSWFNEDHLMIIEDAISHNLNEEQMALIKNPALTWDQMYEIEQGLVNGLSMDDVKSYADASLPRESMNRKRLLLQKRAGIQSNPTSTVNDKYVQEVLRVLRESGMKEEEKQLLSALVNLDQLKETVERYGNYMEEVSLQLKDIKQPGFHERVDNVLDAMRENHALLKEKVHGIAVKIRESARDLVDIAKNSGELAFNKAFLQFVKGTKALFRSMEAANNESMERNNAAIEKFSEIQAQVDGAKTGLKNAGRVLFGRNAKEAEEDKHISIVLKPVLKLLNSNTKELENTNKYLQRCIANMDELEKTYEDLAKENKQSISTLIAGASSRQQKNDRSHRKNEKEMAH